MHSDMRSFSFACCRKWKKRLQSERRAFCGANLLCGVLVNPDTLWVTAPRQEEKEYGNICLFMV